MTSAYGGLYVAEPSGDGGPRVRRRDWHAIDGDVLSPPFISELLGLLDTTGNETEELTAQRDRLRAELDNLVESIALGTLSHALAATAVKTREVEIAWIEERLRTARPALPDRERLRAALEQRMESWRSELREETTVARTVLRRLVGS